MGAGAAIGMSRPAQWLPGGGSDEDCPAGGCAICMEGSPEDWVELPCACKVGYCAGCWEHALAASLRGSGVPRCPTCRSAIHAKLEAPERGGPWRLQYSLMTPEAQAFSVEEERLSRQARAAQIQQLRDLGAYLLRRQPGDPRSMKPTCPCGGELGCWEGQVRLQTGVGGEITCDICNRSLRSGTVWSCQKGGGTIVHSFSHDVCGTCFEEHMGTGRRTLSDEWTYRDDFSLEEDLPLLAQLDNLIDSSDEFKNEDDFGSSDLFNSAEGTAPSQPTGILGSIGLHLIPGF